MENKVEQDALDRVTCLSKEIREKFVSQFPDLIDSDYAFTCFREGWQRGAESAYAEAYNLGEWKWE